MYKSYKSFLITVFILFFAISSDKLFSQQKIENNKNQKSIVDFQNGIILPPTLLEPADNATGVLPNYQFRWLYLAGDISYDIQISTNSSFSTIYDSLSDIPIALYTPPLEKLKRNTTYFWRVRKQVAPPVKNLRVSSVPVIKSDWSTPFSFTTIAPGFAVNTQSLTFDSTKVNNTSYKSVVITNTGTDVLKVTNLIFNGGDASSFNVGVNLPLDIFPGQTYSLVVSFNPRSAGVKGASLSIFHNSQEPDPTEISLVGEGFQTLARIKVNETLNFESAFFLTSPKDAQLTVTNQSDDYLVIEKLYFEKQDNVFSFLDPFPIYIAANDSYNLRIRLNPTKTENFLTNILHIYNSSLNNPNARVTVSGTIVQSSINVVPSGIDFGSTTGEEPIKLDTMIIQNLDQIPSVTISGKTLSGDVGSYEFIKNNTNVTLIPGQTDTVIIKFYPRTSGRKNVLLTISSNYNLAQNLFVNITGVGGENAVLSVNPSSLNFGEIQRNGTRDDSVTISNDGNLDLYISNISIAGTDKDCFSVISGKLPDTLGFGGFKKLKIFVKGNLPVGNKNGQLIIQNNDPNNNTFSLNLSANLKSNVLSVDPEKFIFDTTVIGDHKDATLKLKNLGNIALKIGIAFFDGTFAQDFAFLGITFPYELKPDEEKSVTIRFNPLANGTRFARFIIKSDDPLMPEKAVVLRGVGRTAYAGISVSTSTLEFGRIAINESVTKELCIINTSKEARLQIDSLYFDLGDKQSFSFSKLQYPFYINQDSRFCLEISFNPTGKKRGFITGLNILSSATGNPKIAVAMSGSAAIPSLTTELEEYINFSKVVIDSSKTISFKVHNTGDAYLLIDSAKIINNDAAEFKLSSRIYPIRIDPDEVDNLIISFYPKTIGVKDAKIKIYSNDPNYLGEIKLLAEGVTKSSQTLDVKSNEIPKTYNLSQNYPNPFNPSTRIEYSIPENSFVTIKIFNSLGQEVETLINQQQSPSVYTINWHPDNLPSGLYFYRITTGKFNSLKKMLYIR